MTTLSTIRTLVRRDLKDEDSANYRWADDEIDRAVDKALSDYSLYRPLEQKSTLTTVDGSNVLDISSLTDMIDVVRVEHPVSALPYPARRFSVWGDALMFLAGYTGDGGDCFVYWLKRHTLGTASTIPTAFEHILALGAAAYALGSLSQYSTNLANIGGHEVDRDYASLSQAWFKRFYDLLFRISTYSFKKLKTGGLIAYE